MNFFFNFFIFFIFCSAMHAANLPRVQVGADQLFTEKYLPLIQGKKIGLITNHTAVNGEMVSTIQLLKKHSLKNHYQIIAFFAPEHGITGSSYAAESIQDSKDKDGITIFSLHGQNKRPTEEMLKNIDLLIFDIQDIGSRSYTYSSTLFYAMEEAAKKNIEVVVLDRPNPLNGIVIDGPLMEEKWRSMVGYINVPYCHGMTIGELANLFNEEYKIKCRLNVVPMKGWSRNMTFNDTGLPWIPTSPYIPESSTAFFYPTTGILGELKMVNIGIGYTLPFKIVGAPWINAQNFAQHLNEQKFPGVYFEPFYFKPFYGRFAHIACEGVLIVITDPLKYRPVSTQFLLIGLLKSLYPKQFKEALENSNDKKNLLNKLHGTEKITKLLSEEGPIVWKMRLYHQKERDDFAKRRKKYLISSYSLD